MGVPTVLSALRRLFNRYCDHHFAITLPGFEVFDDQARKIGQVERICFGANSARFEGWTLAENVGVGRPGHLNWHSPDILRNDVNRALDLDDQKRTGFNLAASGSAARIVLAFKTKRSCLQVICPSPEKGQWFKAQIYIRASFARAMLGSTLALSKAFFYPSEVNKRAVKNALRLGHSQLNYNLDHRNFEVGQPIKRPRKITLIMPVFNAFDVLQCALSCIVENTDLNWRLILVEDCSSDQRVRPFLRGWMHKMHALGHDVALLENGKNLGFIGSVNRAFEHALRHRDHVVLINSDALVPKNWASRLLHPILKDSKVASVTPMSNDAEIFTTPVICQPTQLEHGVAFQIDAALRDYMSINSSCDAPAGVGFCMALNHKFLRKLPQFDLAFGKGYGEEVDWCQKTATLGGKHYCQPALFVEHRGGASFGSVTKQRAIARNNQRISKRYPKFDQSVQQFIADDPIRTARLFAACVMLGAQKGAVPIYIAHSMGGGAELYLKDKIAKQLETQAGVIVLRVGGPKRWRIEVHRAEGSILGDTDSFSIVRKFLAPVQKRHILYSCAVGDTDPAALPGMILELLDEYKAFLTFLVHDYFAISPSYCLLNCDGTYTGVPHLQSCDPRHQIKRSNGETVSHSLWRQTWENLLQRAGRIECFSHDSAKLMRAAFSRIEHRIIVVPHTVPSEQNLPTRHVREHATIGILGDIGVQKGAAIVSELAKELHLQRRRGLTIVGRLDPQYQLPANSVETGAYQRNDIGNLANKHMIGAWFIPSIWPETFSYTTHEALATGLPVFCFDIGAQGDAVAAAANGYLIPFELRNQPDRVLQHIERALHHGATGRYRYSRTQKRRGRGFAA